MKTLATCLLLASLSSTARSQLQFQDDALTCPGLSQNESYCAGDSLNSNIIIRCDSGKGYASSCSNLLEAVDPPGPKVGALCYQSAPKAGDANCAWGGLVYPFESAPFRIPSRSTGATTTSRPPPSPSSGFSRLRNTTAPGRGPSTATPLPIPCSSGRACTPTAAAGSTGTAPSPNNHAARPTAGPTASGGGPLASGASGAPYPMSASRTANSTTVSPPTPTASPSTFTGAASRQAQMAGWLLAVAMGFCTLG